MAHPEHQLVWAEIPVTDLEAAKAFYASVLQTELTVNNDGPNPMVDLPTAEPMKGISAHLYPGKPAPSGIGPTVHLAAPAELATVADRVVEAGGKVLSPAIEIPVGAFIYTEDPDGNSVGWFRYKDA